MSGRFRVALAVLLLAVFVYVTAGLAPYFVRDYRLQQHLSRLVRSGESDSRPADATRARVAEDARQLGIAIRPNAVEVDVENSVTRRIGVRYEAEVKLRAYTVRLHFSPSATR